ncbi:hypothetical protein DM02DRAFT_621077 [Periconia macrospinosa]|uniref:Uncharacterized protein n=1 Tax=Periconia macrospinosa TaxID=97972 RepID=A0A2V1CX62_9PLEO|nr:hypothetical protein DM02DRAFT_621077 [Periconia macrospinosa]
MPTVSDAHPILGVLLSLGLCLSRCALGKHKNAIQLELVCAVGEGTNGLRAT